MALDQSPERGLVTFLSLKDKITIFLRLSPSNLSVGRLGRGAIHAGSAGASEREGGTFVGDLAVGELGSLSALLLLHLAVHRLLSVGLVLGRGAGHGKVSVLQLDGGRA
jgi:hypothetical protein